MARCAIRAFLTEGDVLTRLSAYVRPLLADSDPQLRQHAERVSQALMGQALTTTPLSNAPAVQIDDAFFTDLAGQAVVDADYSYAQLLGPDGPHVHNSVRCGISYQGPSLLYKSHHHVAQELYFVLNSDKDEGTGAGVSWRTDRAPAWEERGMSWHLENEHHAMATSAHAGALFFWSWTGDIALHVKHSEE